MISISDLENLLRIGTKAAALGAEVHRLARRAKFQIQTKQSQKDLVTSVDRDSEHAIVTAIRKARPNDKIVSEEGTSFPGSSDVCWIIDPLDGTTNFVHGYPAHAVAIGIEIEGVRAAGVVHDTYHDLIYSGIVNHGAQRGESPIKAALEDDLARSLIGTGFSPLLDVRARQADVLSSLLPLVRDVRRSGCPTLDICAVAAGALDGFYESGLGPWDISAAAAIAEAAGASVVELDSTFASHRIVVVANRSLLERLVEALIIAGAVRNS